MKHKKNTTKHRKRKRIRNNALRIFIAYTLSIISISIFLITFLTIKNQCSGLRNDISELKSATSRNISIVKKLQSEKVFFSSEQYISSQVKDIMVAIAPEPEIINMKNEY